MIAMVKHGYIVEETTMVMNAIQFQAGMSLSDFLECYGSEAQCEAALELMRLLGARDSARLAGRVEMDDAHLGGEYASDKWPIHAVYPHREHFAATVRTFVEFLQRHFQQDPDWSGD
jgi:DNA-binding transcriptional LysR family regulator